MKKVALAIVAVALGVAGYLCTRKRVTPTLDPRWGGFTGIEGSRAHYPEELGWLHLAPGATAEIEVTLDMHLHGHSIPVAGRELPIDNPIEGVLTKTLERVDGQGAHLACGVRPTGEHRTGFNYADHDDIPRSAPLARPTDEAAVAVVTSAGTFQCRHYVVETPVRGGKIVDDSYWADGIPEPIVFVSRTPGQTMTYTLERFTKKQ